MADQWDKYIVNDEDWEKYAIQEQEQLPTTLGQFVGQKLSDVDQQIAQKSNPWGELAQSITQPPKNILEALIRPTQNQLGLIGAVGKTLEAIPANLALSAQRGENVMNPMVSGKAILGAVSGKKQGEMGDIFRGTGMFPEWASSTLGLISSFATGELGSLGRVSKATKQVGKTIGDVAQKGYNLGKMSGDDIVKVSEDLGKGLDEMGAGLGQMYDDLFNEITVSGAKQGDEIVAAADEGQRLIEQLPGNIVKQLSKGKYDKIGQEVPLTLNNLKTMKGILRKSVPQRVWSGRAIGDQNTAVIMNAYDEINNMMSKGSKELSELNMLWKDYRDTQKVISRVIFDGDGNPMENGIKALYGGGGDAGVKKFFDKFAQQWEPAQKLLGKMKAYRNRQVTKKVLGWGSGIAVANYAARKGINAVSGLTK